MSDRYESRAHIAAKADWEGGIDEFVLGYGFHEDQVPEGDTELEAAAREMLAAASYYEVSRDRFMDLLPANYAEELADGAWA